MGPLQHLLSWQPARFEHAWFDGVRDLVRRLADEPDWPSVAALDASFAGELRSVGVKLVEAPKVRPARASDGTLDPSSLYEVRIIERAEIPTRPRNAHDLLNAIAWAAYPRTKYALTRALAEVQRARAVGRTTLPATRTRAHDRLALVDEGALVHARGAVHTSRWIFGHAIWEHAYAGHFAVRATAIDLDVPALLDQPLATARALVDAAFAGADLERVVRGGAGVPVDAA